MPVIVEGLGDGHFLTLLWAGQGWPADVEAALKEVPEPWPPELVAVAPQFSPGALRRLEERRANWADETGEARIVGPTGLLVVRSNATLPSVRSNGLGGAQAERLNITWSTAALDVGEALLALPSGGISTTALAELTGRSASQVSKTLVEFDRVGWTKKVGTRGPSAYRQLAEPDALLRRWAEAVVLEPRPVLEAHALIGDPMDFLQSQLVPALNSADSWAATTWAALELVAPFMTQVPIIHTYVDEESMSDGRLASAMQVAGVRPVETGGRVVFWGGRQPMFRIAKKANESIPTPLPVVTPPRLYADLLALGGRGTDAAEHVRETLLHF